MKKLIFLSILILTLYANETKYFVDYKLKDGLIVTQVIDKEVYSKLIVNIDYYKDKKNKVLLKLDNEIYDISKVYKTADIKEIDTNANIKNDKNFNFPYILLLMAISIIYFLYSQLKKLGKPLKNNQSNILEIKKSEISKKRIDEKIKTEDTEKNILYFKELEVKRVEIYNNLKYNKNIEKENKKDLYKSISILKTNIKNKEDIKKLNDDFNCVLNDIERFNDGRS